jgi:crossover junction endodeoxyribonuclease RusA
MARRTSPPVAMRRLAPFDICVHGIPISAQTKHRAQLQTWREQVRSACRELWPVERAILTGPVRLSVTYYGEHKGPDLDNLVKPIQDALQQVVYGNDRQVIGFSARFEDIDERFAARYMSPVLAAAFVRGDPFVHIEVWYPPHDEVPS